MKKLNFAIFGALLAISLAGQAFAETTIPWTKEGCESVKGTWITAHSATDAGCDATLCHGLNFCRAPQTMNYWSALIWCKSIGHKLPDIETLCPNGLNSGRTCANLSGRMGAEVWSTTPSNNYSQYVAGDGFIGDYQTEKNRTHRRVACTE